jgi:hypothetical protein
MANLVCPRCGATAFRYLYGCEFAGPCYFPSLGRFDAEAYAHRYDRIQNSPTFQRSIQLMNAEWDKVFGDKR